MIERSQMERALDEMLEMSEKFAIG